MRAILLVVHLRLNLTKLVLILCKQFDESLFQFRNLHSVLALRVALVDLLQHCDNLLRRLLNLCPHLDVFKSFDYFGLIFYLLFETLPDL